MSENRRVGTPSSPESLLHPTRRNREVAKALKEGPSTFNPQSQSGPNYRPAERNPDEISISSSGTHGTGTLADSGVPLRAKKTEDMSSKPVLFYGKPTQIDDLDTYCKVRFLSESIIDETQKAGYCASLFRGPALAWLTTYLREHSLDDYGELIAQLRVNFGLSETALQGQYARQLARCRQSKSVQQYALQFKDLATKTGLPEAVKKAQFIQGLKGNIQKAIITSDDYDNFDNLVAECIRIDSEYFNVARRTDRAYNKKPSASRRDNQGRFKSSVKKEYDG